MTLTHISDGLRKPRRPSTPAFKNWYGYSRMPLVYHATQNEFTAFDIERGDLGAHFGTLEQAKYVLQNRLGGNGKILAFWLNLYNPLRLKDVGSFHAEAIADQLVRLGIINKALAAEIVAAGWKGNKTYDKVLRDKIREAGYDGVVYKNTNEGDGNSYIVFDARNIKSATDNTGTYDPESHETVASIGSPDTEKKILRAVKSAAPFDSAKPIKLYRVGGAVRDEVLGIPSKDVDYLVTNVSFDALRAALTPISDKVITTDVGDSMNVIKAVIDHSEEPYDFVIPRTEVYGGSGVHTDVTAFGDPSLPVEEDLSRRDLTINAIAKDVETGEYIDPFGGLEDIKNKSIRAVRDPEQRFAEDRLRMFRVIQFAVRLGFEIDPATLKAIRDNADKVDAVFGERILTELHKAFTKGAGAYSNIRLVRLLKESGLGISLFGKDFDPIECGTVLGDKFATNMLLLFYRGGNYARLKPPTDITNAIDLLRKLRTQDALVVMFKNERYLQVLKDAVQSMRDAELLKKLESLEGVPLTAKDLQMSSQWLMAQGLTGRELGETQKALIQAIYERRVPNETSALQEYVQAMRTGTAAADSIPETIDVDGKERSTRNSEGRLIHPTLDGIQNFWKWFGDSKVVDAGGKPLIVYHGTKHDFDTFSSDKIGTNYSVSKLFYFTDAPRNADHYAEWNSTEADMPNVIPAYLRIENPLVIRTRGHKSAASTVDRQIESLLSKISSKGYDGILVRTSVSWVGGNVFAVLSPNQIKSAVGNAGTFSNHSESVVAAADTIPETIDVDGKQRSTKNSLGRSIHPTLDGIQNFWKWFGDSKAINKQGQPIIFYHGTGKNFSAFDVDLGKGKDYGTGVFFSASPEVASSYAPGQIGHVVPVYLRVLTPVVVEAGGKNWDKLGKNAKINKPKVTVSDDEDQALLAALQDTEPVIGLVRTEPAKRTTLGNMFPRDMKYDDDFMSTSDLARWARKSGHDSIIIRHVVDRGPHGIHATEGTTEPNDVCVVFDGHSVKSAVGNNGNFDPSRKEITASADSERDEFVASLKSGFAELGLPEPKTDRLTDDQLRKLGVTLKKAQKAAAERAEKASPKGKVVDSLIARIPAELKEEATDSVHKDLVLFDNYGVIVHQNGLISFERLTPKVARLIGNKPILLYHHTSSALLSKIKETGLTSGNPSSNPHMNTRAGVYLTTEEGGNAPRIYGQSAAKKHGGQHVTLEVKTRLGNLRPDPDDADIKPSEGKQFVIDAVPAVDILNLDDELHSATSAVAAESFPGTDIEIPAGSRFFHGTPKQDVPAGELKAHGGCLWLAYDPQTAQTYIPPGTNSVYASPSSFLRVPEKYDDRGRVMQESLGIKFDVSRYSASGEPESYSIVSPQEWVELQARERNLRKEAIELDRKHKKLEAEYLAAGKVYDANMSSFSKEEDEAEWAKLESLNEEVEKAYAVAKDAWEKAQSVDARKSMLDWVVARLRELDYNVDRDSFLQIFTDASGKLLPGSYRNSGNLHVLTTTRPLKIRDIIGDAEPDQGDYQYNRLDLFAQLAAAGYDGVRIGDFAQHHTEGNVGHYSIGVFPAAIKTLRDRVIENVKHPTDFRRSPEWEADPESSAQPAVASTALEFQTSMRGHHHGQSDLTLIASIDGQIAGKIEYSVYNDVPSVQYIEVSPEFRRQKIGTKLMQKLQAEFPDVEIEVGGLTPDGAALYKSLPKEITPVPEVVSMRKELEAINLKLAEYQKMADSYWAGDKTNDKRMEFLNAISNWDDLRNQAEELEDKLRGTKETLTLIKQEDVQDG